MDNSNLATEYFSRAGRSLAGSFITTKDAWCDGAVGIDDFASPVFAGLEGLGIFIDPVNWLVGGILDPIYDLILDYCTPLKAAIETITGSPEKVEAAAAGLQDAAKQTADAANQLIEHVNAILTNWEGKAREACRTAMAAAVEMQRDIADKLHSFANVYYTVASIVSALKEIVVSLIKMFVTDLITKGLLAAAAGIPSLGSTIAAYMTWAAGKYALVAGKVSRLFARAAGKLSKLAGETSKIGKFFASIASRLTKLSTKYDDLAGELNKLRDANRSDLKNNIPLYQRRAEKWEQKAADRAEAGNMRGAKTAERKVRRFAESEARAWEMVEERSKNMMHKSHKVPPGGYGAGAASGANWAYGDGQRQPGDSASKRGDLHNPADDIGTIVP
ncbi:WXG100 family type VII secretion target [uncultured Tessaracoccus sp.]|uniref:WXG100 family type VII secretion target n=1 Tax=uncultured Tessaracoccus sp. TaxID=905023 RepID=UPI00261EF664|nr:WXG100 family type VII secretion target [uncultured Tessaracoccus sp.]